MQALLALALAAALAAFCTLRLRTYLQPFQQEEYGAPRFVAWLKHKRALDRWTTLGLLIGIPFALMQPQAAPLIAALWLLYRIRQEPNPVTTGKKPLVLTPRATRIWWLAALLATLPVIGLIAAPLPLSPYSKYLLLPILLVQLLPAFLLLANLLLRPAQLMQNRRFLRNATATLQRLNPTVIGLTGSFGKTSTKYILSHLLSAQAPTFATPGSVNTPLGIARIVTEQLQPHHQYFLAEMGAYGPGSIARLCKLAPPRISCITAVGAAHYERFKSLATVAAAKFEIADATHANGGLCILYVDGIPDDLWQPRVAANPTGYRLITARKALLRPGDTFIQSAEATPKGLALTLVHNKQTTQIQTPLFGMAQTGNLAVAFAMAAELGVPKATLAAAFATVPAAPHRLNVQHSGPQTVIDDSYNANPAGFKSALETLTLLAGTKPRRRRVLITPGMVELGTRHAEEHAQAGLLAAHHADVILAILPQRIPTFTQAIKVAWGLSRQSPEIAGNSRLWHTQNGQILAELPTLAAARSWLQTHGLANDVLLIENDLPDLYESPWLL